MAHFRKIKLLFVLLILLTLQTFAQENVSNFQEILNVNDDQIESSPIVKDSQASKNSDKREKRGGLVVSAYLGRAKTNSTALTISQPSLNTNLKFENVELRSRSFESPQYYGLRVGYFIPKYDFIGVEAEFVHLKVYSNPQQRVRVSGIRQGAPISGEIQLGEIVQQYSVSHGANLLLFNGAVRRGFQREPNSGRNRWVFTARAGIGPTIPQTESSIEGVRQEQYEIGRLGWQVADGAEFRLWRGLYLLGEYKYT